MLVLFLFSLLERLDWNFDEVIKTQWWNDRGTFCLSFAVYESRQNIVLVTRWLHHQPSVNGFSLSACGLSRQWSGSLRMRYARSMSNELGRRTDYRIHGFEKFQRIRRISRKPTRAWFNKCKLYGGYLRNNVNIVATASIHNFKTLLDKTFFLWQDWLTRSRSKQPSDQTRALSFLWSQWIGANSIVMLKWSRKRERADKRSNVKLSTE